MTIIHGGAYADGGARTLLTGTPANNSAKLDSWLHLIADPTGRYPALMRHWISHKDYLDNPSSTNSMRSELAGATNALTWGQVYWYAWRFIVPTNWVTYVGEEDSIVLQCHDVDASAIARRPVFEANIRGGILRFTVSNDNEPLGTTLFSMPIAPGQEVSVALHAMWADSVAVPAVSGALDLYVDGVAVAQHRGLNHWTTTPDPSPPYIKAGIYVPLHDAEWWAGMSREMWHVGAAVGDAAESLASMQAVVGPAPRVIGGSGFNS